MIGIKRQTISGRAMPDGYDPTKYDHAIAFRRNTRSASCAPEPPDEFEPGDLMDGRTGTRLMIILSGDDFSRVVSYGVIVERWEYAKHGRGRRAYLAEFADRDRRRIARWHARLYRWYLVSGTPRRIALRPATIELLQRAANFFATI